MAYDTGFGYRMQRGDGGSPESFTTIPGQIRIGGPNQKHPVVNRTNGDDTTAARARKVRRGYTDEGQVTLDGYYEYNNVTIEAVEGDLEDTTPGNWRIVDRAATVLHTFTALLTDFDRDHPQEELNTYHLVFEIDGTLTIA